MEKKYELAAGIIAELFLIILLCVFPLYINRELYIRLTYHKTIFLYTSTAITAICFLAVFVYTAFVRLKKVPADGFSRNLKNILPLSVMDYGALAFLYWNIFSASFSPYKGNLIMGATERHDGILSQLVYVFIYFIVSRYYKLKCRDFHLFAVSAAIVSIIGILQFYNITFTSWFPFDIYYHNALDQTPYDHLDSYTMIFRTTIGHHNIVSTFTCVAALFFFALYIFRTGRAWSYLYLATAALCTFMMFLSDTSSGIVALVAGFIFLFFLFTGYKASEPASADTHRQIRSFLYRNKGGCRNFLYGKREVLIRFLISAVAAFAAYSIYAATYSVPIKGMDFLGDSTGTIYEVQEIIQGNIDEEFGSRRILIWRQAVEAWLQRPIMGSGPDTFHYAVGEEFQRMAVEKYWVAFDKAHNEYLQILVCLGLPGLLAYLVLIGGTGVSVLKGYFIKKIHCPYYIAAACAVFTYAVQAFFNINIPMTAPLLWIFLGILNSKVDSSYC